jgi:enoyl-CoA hydratase/carnithine racemase
MPTIELSFNDSVAIVRFNRPKVNAINRAMTEELNETFANLAEAEQVEAAILVGRGNVFSAGLDLFEIFDYDEEAFDRFWASFHRAIVQMLGFPKPLVAAVNGHAPAGGCVFAMCCDHRVMADGEFHIGLNEVPVGIVMPNALVELTKWRVGPTKAEHMLLNGSLMTAKEAHALGLVEDYCPQAEVEIWAETRVTKWLGMHRDAWRKTKAALRKPLLETLDMTTNEGYGAMIREWWSADGRAAIGKTIKEIAERKTASKTK